MEILRSSSLAAREPRAEIQKALENISETDLRQWVSAISVPRNFYLQPEANAKVRSHVAEVLRSFGYQVELQGPYSNVVALPRHPAKALTLVGAHYDSVSQTPGADDNGSAVAAMLGCAKA